ncbi:MAG: rod shape-determining protein MreC [Deltaproteobacteria bacterium]|nr:rod shape-determining protein MreC [Deltaproteobacteria bacterium]
MKQAFEGLDIVLPVLLIIVCLTLLSLSAQRSYEESTFNSATLQTMGPVSSILGRLANQVEGIWLGYFNLIDVRRENEQLRKVIDRQSRQIVALNEEHLANERLRRLVAFHDQPPGRYLSAKVVGWDPSPWFQSLVVAAGTADGVSLDAPVMTERGVVGRVVELAPHYAKILLLTDSASSVDAFVQRNRVNALLTGRGQKAMTLDYIRKIDDVRPGDLVVTSGLDGIFPSGLPLGSVTVVDKQSLGLFLAAEVSPMVDFDRLEEVLILADRPKAVDWLGLAPDLKAVFEKKKQEGR